MMRVREAHQLLLNLHHKGPTTLPYLCAGGALKASEGDILNLTLQVLKVQEEILKEGGGHDESRCMSETGVHPGPHQTLSLL